ncbi:WD40 repeat domain-containing protein [Streptomyces sp. ID05-47C]|uniref:WD40 repeat domain-containing protein n=1 Tax=Streptomyces sp. ID05-47C TaxID=3028665 RepID=UPI0029BD16AA|nr:WD40 repeat domain-containing protein [Streptomyces sp. ID05-47C]MDX3570870.1 WD40 repeat domain-containing protein [Streptomyces sp. ID05-47C]
MNLDDQQRDLHAGEQRTHARIAAALARLIRPDAVTVPHPYLSRYLAHHAALGGELDDSHVPPDLLPWITGDGVRGLLNLPHAHHADRAWLTAWAAVEPYLQDADLPSRCSSLHLAYTALKFPGVPHQLLPQEATEFADSRLCVRWSRWAPPSNVLATLSRRSLSLTTAEGPGGAALLALGNVSGSIEFIDTTTGTPVGDRMPAHDGDVRCLFFVPHTTGGGALVSGSTDGTVRVWDPVRGTLLDHRAFGGHTWTSAVTGYRDDAGALTVAAVDGHGTVKLWREHSAEHHLADMNAHPLEQAAFALALADGPGDRQVLVGVGHTLRIWDIADHRLLHEYPVDAPVRSLTDTTVPGRFATGHSDGSITLWDTASGAQAIFPGEGEPVTALAALHIDGLDLLASAASGPPIALWDIGAERRTGQLTGHTDTVTALCTISADGTDRLASTARDNTVRLWDTRAIHHAISGTAEAPAAVAAAITPDSAAAPHLAVSYATAQTQVWDTLSGTATGPFGSDTQLPPPTLTWAPENQDRHLLLWAATDHTIRSWDPVRGTAADILLKGHSQPVRTLASTVACGGRRLAISGDDFTVRWWDLDSGQPLQLWRHPYTVRTVAAASDGVSADWFASGSTDGAVRLWDTTGGTPRHVFYCRQGFINAVAINAGLSRLPPFLASGGDDGTVRLWDLAALAPIGEPLQGHTDAVEAITTWTTFADVPRPYVASSSRDGTIRFWEAATSRCVLQLATGSPVHTLSAHLSGESTSSVVLTMAGEAGVAVLELDLEDLSPTR